MVWFVDMSSYWRSLVVVSDTFIVVYIEVAHSIYCFIAVYISIYVYINVASPTMYITKSRTTRVIKSKANNFPSWLLITNKIHDIIIDDK